MVRRTNKKKKKGNKAKAAAAAVALDRFGAAVDFDPATAIIDTDSATFSICGREVPTEVYTDVRNQAYAGIIKNWRGIFDGMAVDPITNKLDLTRWEGKIHTQAWMGCHESAVAYYRNQPEYPEAEFAAMNTHCGMEFADKVLKIVSKMYILNMEKHASRKAELQQNMFLNAPTKTAARKDAPEKETDEIWDIVHVIPTDGDQITCRNNNCSQNAVVSWASNLNPEDTWDICEDCQQKEFGGWPLGFEKKDKRRGSTDEAVTNEQQQDVLLGRKGVGGGLSVASCLDADDDDDDDDEKKPAAINVCSTDNDSVASSSLSSPNIVDNDEHNLSGIQSHNDTEKNDLDTIFDTDNLDFDFDWKENCISDTSFTKLITKEKDDGSCSHFNTTSGRCHLSRALEVLLLFEYWETNRGFDVPLSVTIAVEQVAGIDMDDANSDPEFSYFLFSTVTNILRINLGVEPMGEVDDDSAAVRLFSRCFLSKAVEIKHRVHVGNAITVNNNEELHARCLRNLYDQKLLKYKRDLESTRGMINICYRETKEYCQCMKLLRVSTKKRDKVVLCKGCKNTFPKKELQYCSGCMVSLYCSSECSKYDWVDGNHKQCCPRKNYVRCSSCRVIFPSDERSIHTCNINHDVTL